MRWAGISKYLLAREGKDRIKMGFVRIGRGGLLGSFLFVCSLNVDSVALRAKKKVAAVISV